MARTSILLSILLFLIPILAATNVDADFDYFLSGRYFDTDMTFTTGMTISADPAYVVEGDPDNLQNGDTVCAGATLTVVPSSTSKWAVSSLSIKSQYPESPCAGPDAGGSTSYNKNIKWLSSSVFDEHDDFGDDYGYKSDYSLSSTQEMYSQLGTFYDEPTTYINLEDTYTGKESGANVFCKGTLAVRDGTSAKGGSPWSMPVLLFGGVPFTVNDVGSHPISTKLEDVKCFGAIVKHPLNTASSPSCFRIYYFTKGSDQNVADTTKTININVEEGSGTCNMHELSVESTGPISDDLTGLKIRMHNDGDPMKVTSVTSSNPDYTALPFTEFLCAFLGIPDSLCPESSGFNEPIATGGNKDLYVLLGQGAGASGGTTLNFQAETTATSCGGPVECTEAVPIYGNVSFTCEIDPASASLATNEVAEFQVECKNLADDVITCSGSNWTWQGLTGVFNEKDNTHAETYTTSTAGSGTLTYSSGMAECHSHISVTTPSFCEIVPLSDTLYSGMGREFLVTCADADDSPMPCVGSDWQWADGLTGGFWEKDNEHALAYVTSSPGSTGTLTYTSGDAECLSNIDVNTSASPFDCELNPPSADLNYSESQDFELNCWEDGVPTEPDDADYGLFGGLGGGLSGESTDGATYTAPDHDTDGDLGALGWFGDYFIPSFAGITVTNGTGGEECDETLDPDCDGENDDGSSDDCTIAGHGAPLSVFPGYSGWVGINCGIDENLPCEEVEWTITSGSSLYDSDDNGTGFTVAGSPGTSGKITAVIGGDPSQKCFRLFNILETWCWEFS